MNYLYHKIVIWVIKFWNSIIKITYNTERYTFIYINYSWSWFIEEIFLFEICDRNLIFFI